MLVTCDNCGRQLLSESDVLIFQHRPEGEYYSCGCFEFRGFDFVLKEIEFLRELIAKGQSIDIDQLLSVFAIKIETKRKTGHEVLSPANQECGLCGEAMYTSAGLKQCKGKKS